MQGCQTMKCVSDRERSVRVIRVSGHAAGICLQVWLPDYCTGTLRRATDPLPDV